MTLKTMTVAEFRRRISDPLNRLPNDTKIIFGAGDLSFGRIKNRQYPADNQPPNLVQIEFNETYQVDTGPD